MKKTKLLKKVLLVTLAAGVCLGCGMGAREVRAEETGGLYQGGKLVYNWEELQNQGYITLYRNRDTIKTTKKFKELSGDLVIPDSVKKIDEYGFVGTHLDTVTFPGSLEEIGKNAFLCCHDLKSVIIPNSVTKLGWNAFCGCDSLESVKLGTGVTVLSGSVFRECTSLKGITLPDCLTKIGASAFEGCTSLKSVAWPKNLKIIGQEAFRQCPFYKVVLPEGVEKIEQLAFCNCINLDEIVIPDSVKTIGNGVFGYCRSLTNIFIPANTNVHKGTFYGTDITIYKK